VVDEYQCYVLAYGVQYGRRVNRVVVFMERERERVLLGKVSYC
jgi:hypothetical protein